MFFTTELNSIIKEPAEKYQFIINNILDIIAEIDLDGTFSYVSPHFKDMFGYNTEEVIGSSIFNYIHPDDRSHIMETFEKAIQEEIIVDTEFRVRNRKGYYIPVYIKGTLVRINDKVKLVSVLRDISNKKHIEQKLKESEEKFRRIAEQSLMGIVIAQDNKIKYINKVYANIFGYTIEEMIDWELKDAVGAIHPEDSELVLNQLSKKQKGEKDVSVHYQYRGIKKSGEIIWIENFSKSIEYDGRPANLATIIDITEKKKAEELLKQSEEKYRMIFNGANEPIGIMDEKNIVDCNDIFVKLFKYNNKDEIMGLPPWKLSPIKQPDGKDSIKKANEFIEKSLLGEPQRFYWKHMKKDGTLFDTEISLSSFKLENKNYIMAMIRDITERQNAERELREINQLKTELLERTSHELKTPLISIKGFTELLLELHKEKLDNDILSILQEIRQGTEQLETIINKLLKTTLLDSGKYQFQPRNEDLSFLIKFCVKDLRGLAKTRNHFIKLDLPDKLYLDFEKERIYEVVTHLIINAIKYTPPYGEIRVQAKETKDNIIISVQDNGIGLSEDEQKKIFKQFGKIERYGQGWDIGTEGTGMGLYTSKKIVELHGGEIWVESEGRNKGARFCFSLPLNKN
ncbi:MAG: PAS domain S-box protein [Promethearchaeota archaeon]